MISSDAFALALGRYNCTFSVPASHAGPCRAAAHSTLSHTGTAPPTAPKEKRSNSPPAPPGRTHPARAPPGDAFVLLGATAEASLVEMLGETVGRRRALRRSSPRYAASIHGPDLPTRAGCGGRIGGRQPAARLAVALRRGRAGAVPGLELLLVCSRAAANAGRVVGYRQGALDVLYIEALGDLDALEHWVGGHHERVARHGPEGGQCEAGERLRREAAAGDLSCADVKCERVVGSISRRQCVERFELAVRVGARQRVWGSGMTAPDWRPGKSTLRCSPASA